MIIESVTTYSIYLTDEEFELMHRICSSVGYGYHYYGEKNEGYWKLVADEEMIDEIRDLLDREYSIQRYDKCNRPYALEIRELLDDIYYELNY